MDIFPASFPMKGKTVVIVGGGEEAQRKARLFAKTPASIIAFADVFESSYLEEFENKIDFSTREVLPEDLSGAALAVIAIDDRDEAERLAIVAKSEGVPVNVVDEPDLCDWFTPSIVDRGAVVVSIATGGAAPVLARSIREQIERALPKGIGLLARVSGRMRREVRSLLPDAADLRRFWEQTLSGVALDRANAGDAQGTEDAIRAAAQNAKDRAPGQIHLVGAGPGDPELLTIKALRVLQSADVVYYDALVGDEILDFIRRDATRVYVGKRKDAHSVPQDEIAELMIASAREGKRVVRLKGGDPFVFGRGGEEVEAVQAAGLEIDVVPGISSALGCAASAKIPLTHRDKAQSVTFVTGHAKDGEPDLDWPALARANQTVVVFMGVGTARSTATNLMDAGRAPTTPIAVIENGTREREIIAYGELFDLPDLIAREGIKGPALLIIGEVAAKRDTPLLKSVLEEIAA